MTNIEMDVARSQIRANKAIASQLEEIDWEQRRYEIAKECLNALLIRSANHFNPTPHVIAKMSVNYADALINELKENNSNI